VTLNVSSTPTKTSVGGDEDLTVVLDGSYSLPLTFVFYSPTLAPSFERTEDVMDEKALFLKFWNKEAPATRKVLSRIPEGSTYAPDPKSRPAREIAWQIVCEEIILGEGLVKGELEWKDLPTPPTLQAIVAHYDEHHDRLAQAMASLPSSEWERRIPFLYQGQELMAHSGYDHAWGFLFDIVHHRGQISTYLRPMGSTVPQIYGPTADEP